MESWGLDRAFAQNVVSFSFSGLQKKNTHTQKTHETLGDHTQSKTQ